MKKILFLFYCAAIGIILIQSCVYHEFSGPGPGDYTDSTLYNEMKSPDGYQYYNNGNTLTAASQSPHGSFKLRFNEIAWEALDESGELPSGQTFPPGSVLVKEVYQGNDLYVYAVLKKAPSDGKSSNGWLWAEYFPDGSIAYSIDKNGLSCTGCHSESPNRDLVRTFDLH